MMNYNIPLSAWAGAFFKGFKLPEVNMEVTSFIREAVAKGTLPEVAENAAPAWAPEKSNVCWNELNSEQVRQAFERLCAGMELDAHTIRILIMEGLGFIPEDCR